MSNSAIGTGAGTSTNPARFKQLSGVPTRKVVSATLASALASALATIFVWAFNTYVSPQTPLPDIVAGAITTVFTAVITFAAAYFVSPAMQDQITPA